MQIRPRTMVGYWGARCQSVGNTLGVSRASVLTDQRPRPWTSSSAQPSKFLVCSPPSSTFTPISLLPSQSQPLASRSFMLKLPLLGQRHPRYTIALAGLVLCAYWFLSSSAPPLRPVRYNANHDLKARIEREERKYRDMLPQRHDLITRFGPTPAQVVMYVHSPSLRSRIFP